MHNHQVFTYEKDPTFHRDDHHRHDAHEQPQKRRGTSHINPRITSRLSAGISVQHVLCTGQGVRLNPLAEEHSTPKLVRSAGLSRILQLDRVLAGVLDRPCILEHVL